MGKPSNIDLVERAAGSIFMTTDLVSGDGGLTGGGKLNIQQADSFIRLIVDQPTILNEIRTVTMNGPEMRLNKIVMTDQLLHKPLGSITPLLSGDYAAPSTSYIDLQTQELVAEVRLPYDVLEDNIERGRFEQTVMELTAEKIAYELETLLLTGDKDHAVLPTGGGWPTTDMRLAQDGVLLLADAYDVTYSSPPVIDESVFAAGIATLPTRYQRFKPNMRFYCAHRLEFDYTKYLGQRLTNLGDLRITTTYNDQLRVYGVPIRACSNMPDDTILFCDPKNIIMGIQRKITVEMDRDISARELIFVTTLRIAVGLEDKAGCVQINGLYA
jgi:hypothetical protein